MIETFVHVEIYLLNPTALISFLVNCKCNGTRFPLGKVKVSFFSLEAARRYNLNLDNLQRKENIDNRCFNARMKKRVLITYCYIVTGVIRLGPQVLQFQEQSGLLYAQCNKNVGLGEGPLNSLFKRRKLLR